MFGRIRALPSSPDGMEVPPSKILKDDSFSIYEATLMKLKFGAQGDLSVSSKEVDEDSTINSSCVEVADLEANSSPGSVPSSEILISPSDEITMIDTDCSSLSSSPSSVGRYSIRNQEQRSHKNVTILHLFSKFKDSKLGQSNSASVSSSYSETHSRRGTGSIQSSTVREC